MRLQSGSYAPAEERARVSVLRFVLALAAAATLLTNAYYLRFLEPSTPRAYLAVLLIAAALLSHWRLALPRSRAEVTDLGRRAAVPALLVLIVAIGFGLREWGSRSGLPQSYPADEFDYVNRGLQMIKRGDFNPHWWYHPTLPRYATVIVYVVVFVAGVAKGRWREVGELAEEDMLYWGRFVSVLAGAAAIGGTFALARRLLGRRLLGTRTALLAAALLAVFPGAVTNSQFNKPDTLAGLLALLSVMLALRYLDAGSRGRALACGVVVGLAAAAKYNAGWAILSLLVAVMVRRRRLVLASSDLYLGMLGVVLGFFLGCPYALADFPRFLNHLALDIHEYGVAGREDAEGVDNWWNHAGYLASHGAGALPMIAAGAGLALLLRRMNGRRAVFLVFPLVYFSHYSAQRIKHEASLVPLYPFLAILAAYSVVAGAAWLSSRAGRRPGTPRHVQPALVVAGALALLAAPLVRSVRHDQFATRRDSGSYAREWIDQAFAPGTHFAVERFSPVLDRRRYKVTSEARLTSRSLDGYRDAGVQYLIVTSLSYARYRPEHRQSREYQQLFAACPLVGEFPPADGPGPTVRILQVPPLAPPLAGGTDARR